MLSRKERERECGRVEDQRFREGSGIAVLLLQLQHGNIYQDTRIVGQFRSMRACAGVHAAWCIRFYGAGRWSEIGE